MAMGMAIFQSHPLLDAHGNRTSEVWRVRMDYPCNDSTGRSQAIGGNELSTLQNLLVRTRVRLSHADEGSALVEMAVVLPLVMLIMTGIFSFSLLLFRQIQLTETVCNGGRYLAVARAAADPCASVYSAIQNSPGLGVNPTIAITQNGTTMPTTCPYNTTTNTSYLIQGATVNVSVVSTSGLAVYGSAFKTFYLGSQISEIVQ
jgi:Flp pilus assembly protein TadG